MTVAITRLDLTEADLRALAARTQLGVSNAIAAILDTCGHCSRRPLGSK